jgi:hypothetical protein
VPSVATEKVVPGLIRSKPVAPNPVPKVRLSWKSELLLPHPALAKTKNEMRQRNAVRMKVIMALLLLAMASRL